MIQLFETNVNSFTILTKNFNLDVIVLKKGNYLTYFEDQSSNAQFYAILHFLTLNFAEFHHVPVFRLSLQGFQHSLQFSTVKQYPSFVINNILF